MLPSEISQSIDFFKSELHSLVFNKNSERSTLPFDTKHKGLFIALLDKSTQEEVLREGFLEPDIKTDISDSISRIAGFLSAAFLEGKTEKAWLSSSLICMSVIHDYEYLRKPLDWDEKKDGVSFQWGNKYKGFLLPYEIKRLGLNKIALLDRLCSHKVGVPSSFWRLPEGLVAKFIVSSLETEF